MESSPCDSHIIGPVFVADLCALLQRSEAHFSRSFKRTFGESPHAFLVRRRVGCGFADQPHLCKHFRQDAFFDSRAARELGARGDRREQNIRSSEYFDRLQIACTYPSDCNPDVARLVGRHRRSGLTMLLEDRRTDGSDAVLHHKVVTVVGQCVSRGVVVKSRHNRADAAAFRSWLTVYLIESNFRDSYAIQIGRAHV